MSTGTSYTQNSSAPVNSKAVRRVFTVAAGHSVYASFNWVFDNVLYVYTVHRLGLLLGGTLMTLLAMIQCALTLVVYQRMRIDWVGVGSLLRLTEKGNLRWWERILAWAIGKGTIPIFLTLCVFQDAFITTAYFKKGSFDTLTGKDWRTFGLSVVVSNFYWTLRSGVVAAIVATGWNWVTS